MKASTFVAVIATLQAAPYEAGAHIDWTRTNAIDPDCLALYHVTSNQVSEGMQVTVPQGLPAGRSLNIQAPAGASASTSADVAQSIFLPYSFRFNSVQDLKSSASVGGAGSSAITGDLTIEARFKWHAGMTSSSLQFGLEDGPKMQVTYDPANPGNDKLGLLGKNTEYRSAPQFTNWLPFIEHDGGIGVWAHAGLCIYSTGASLDDSQTMRYSPGSTARFYINGHLVGDFSVSAIDIAGVAIAETSQIIMRCIAGSHVSFDEYTIWSKDWSDNGQNFSPFADGRGSGVSSVSDWQIY